MAKLKWLVFCIIFLLFTAEQAQASVVLRLIAANPSKGQTQKVLVKAYLPKEAKPEDILDKEDLDIAYDTQQGSYYVYKEYEIKPGEVLEKNVELRDIWVVPTQEIESLRLESVKLEGLLKNTEFADRIAFLKSGVEAKLSQIIEYQKSSTANPESHISDYRENLKVLEAAKADLALARSLLAQVKTFPTVTVWRLIVAIIIFLGILGISFYIIWQKQIKIITQDTFVANKDESGTEAKPAVREAKDEKKIGVEDIERIIKKEET